MAQATPGSKYTVQQGDTLYSIAQQAYGDGNKWPVIAQANAIADPNLIYPGQVLYIPSILSCRVTASDGLNARAQPTSQSTLITSFPTGTVLQYYEVVNGENVAGNNRWGHSPKEYYFWMGGTDHPNG